jgi:hypothetical protein
LFPNLVFPRKHDIPEIPKGIIPAISPEIMNEPKGGEKVKKLARKAIFSAAALFLLLALIAPAISANTDENIAVSGYGARNQPEEPAPTEYTSEPVAPEIPEDKPEGEEQMSDPMIDSSASCEKGKPKERGQGHKK